MYGRHLSDAITAKNLSLSAGARARSLWPKTQSSTGGGDGTKIWNKTYQNSVTYFEDLFDVKNMNNPEKRRAFVDADLKLIYDQVEPPAGRLSTVMVPVAAPAMDILKVSVLS